MDHPPDRVRNPLGLPWAVSIAVLVAIVAAQSIPFSLYQPYDPYPDMDLVVAYNALLINSGFPQELLEHTGYLYFLLVAGWFRLLHSIGILSIVNLTALPPVADLAAFHSGWQQIIEAGRMLTIGFIALFAATFATLVRWLLNDGRIGFLAASPLQLALARFTRSSLCETSRCLRFSLLSLF